MEVILKKVITEAAENGTLHQKDWATMPLPQEIIQMQKAAAPRHPWGPQVSTDNTLPAEWPRKRKSPDTDADESSVPPWRRKTNNNTFESRISRANPPEPSEKADKNEKRLQKKKEQLGVGTSKFEADREKRSRRFGYNSKSGTNSPWSSRDDSPTPDSDTGPIVGTCEDLEKKYFRLTAPPKPSSVRPLHILEQTLELLKNKWRKENNYNYICDQFKSLRQDLTVQHIKNDFTVTVYEVHARIALEQGDISEYNQCQTQLRALYSQGLNGNPAEFLAYRILYFIYTCNSTGMNDVLADLTPTDKDQAAVKHALEVRSALALGNYHKFFRLYLDPPNMGGYLMDKFIERERLAAIANISKGYREVQVRFITEELGFNSDHDCLEFLCGHGVADELFQQKGKGLAFICHKSTALFETARVNAFPKKGGK